MRALPTIMTIAATLVSTSVAAGMFAGDLILGKPTFGSLSVSSADTGSSPFYFYTFSGTAGTYVHLRAHSANDAFSPTLVVGSVDTVDENTLYANLLLPLNDFCVSGNCVPNPIRPSVDFIYKLPVTTTYTVEFGGLNFDFGYGPNAYPLGVPDVTKNFDYQIVLAPEPATLATMAFGLATAGLMSARRRARRAKGSVMPS